MGTRRLEGWLFDIDELGPQVVLWVYTEAGELMRLTEAFHPPVYVQGGRGRLRRLAQELDRRGFIARMRWAERREFWSGERIEVLELQVADASLLPKLRNVAAACDRELTFYNCDIPAAQYYLYLSGLFPLCRLACEVDETGNVIEIAPTDSRWQIDYALPDLRILRMRGERMHPPGDRSRIVLECEGQQTAVRLGNGARAIQAFNAFIKQHNPDVILSERGDTLLLPALLRLVKRQRLDLALDRDRLVTKRKVVTEGRTYFSYGRIIYKGPSYPLFGRWHIDAKNSFIHRETELDGLVELARLARVPVQRMARTSPGSAMSSMQMNCAVAQGILVPWRKSEPERYKTARELLTVDKGGLTFQPRVGAFEHIAEIDFASMYPAIMVRHNVSPETVLCSCCTNQAVPEANYNLCEKRRGLIPQTLKPLLERRRQYKQLMRADSKERDTYDARQTAIKWMLVSCFGYLGYKNARFGRIEAHEAVTAFGRDKLLRAKEMAEARGYRVLHALTDSLWLKREPLSESDVLTLCDEITEATQVEMSLEGVYKWIVFLSSKQNEARPVACRYYGVFENGRLKLRGLACRRSDTPPFIKDVQMELLALLAQAGTLAERAQLTARAEALFRERVNELASGTVAPHRLLVRRTLTKEIDDYVMDTRTAVAARQLRQRGVNVHPGEQVAYLITDAKAKDKSKRVQAEGTERAARYDVAEHIKLLEAAFAEVMALPTLPPQTASLNDRSLIQEIRDVFLCHANEDKAAVVEPLIGALKEAGISYWYDRAEIKWGDSLTGKVNEGLGVSRYVVVVLSLAFLGKHWPAREMNAALNLEATTGEVKVLPLLVGSPDEVSAIGKQLPLLSDKLHLVWNGAVEAIVAALQSRLQK